jgi:hypothetical protein
MNVKSIVAHPSGILAEHRREPKGDELIGVLFECGPGVTSLQVRNGSKSLGSIGQIGEWVKAAKAAASRLTPRDPIPRTGLKTGHYNPMKLTSGVR